MFEPFIFIFRHTCIILEVKIWQNTKKKRIIINQKFEIVLIIIDTHKILEKIQKN